MKRLIPLIFAFLLFPALAVDAGPPQGTPVPVAIDPCVKCKGGADPIKTWQESRDNHSAAPKIDVEKLKAEAEQGVGYAMVALASKYAEGVVVPQDLVQAYMWYSLYPEGDFLDQFDDLAMTMTPEQIAAGKKLALQMQVKIDSEKKKTVKGGAGVLCIWSMLVSIRSGIDHCSSGPRPHQNLEDAYFWLSLAKDTSGIRKQVGRKLTQEQRLIIKKRIADWKPTLTDEKPLDASQMKAAERFGSDESGVKTEMLAANGNALAQFEFGAAYQYGLHREQDFKEAESWYLKAAEQGELHAQQNLGVLYSSASDGGIDDKQLAKLLDEQLGRINDYIVANTPTPVTKAELEAKIKNYHLPYGCLSGDEGRGIVDAWLPPEKLRKVVDEVISVPGVPQMEPCL